ncbi:MAG: UvrD-helicase domain-containing protein [Candidatus Paceibacterota bacterium]
MDLSKLNKEQKQAVEYGNGPLMIVAGAGTGKTTVITNRIAYLIEEKGLKPEEILALTFTDKAAREMEDRVEALLPFGYYDFWISTFHSFCDRILKNYGLYAGLPTNYKLLNSSGGWVLVRKNFEKFNFLKEYRPLGNPTKFIQALIRHFHQCKNEGIYPEDYLDYADSLKLSFDNTRVAGESSVKIKKSKRSSNNDEDEIVLKQKEYERVHEVALAYHTYQKLLLDNSCLDFGDLINYTLKLFERRPEILKKFQDQFKYIMVDEFQDTNLVQYELVKKLAAPKNNITAVADDDQCLPGDMFVEKWEKEAIKEEKIKNIKKGDVLLTGIGRGHMGASIVKNVFKNKKKTDFITVTTRSGNKITVTDNHKMFCAIPSSSRMKKSNYHYVYLMFRDDIGWRIGKTDNVAGRLKFERSADKIIALRAFATDEEARYYETLWSLKYGIPTGCFCERKGVIIKNHLLERLYKEIDVSENVLKLANDLNVDINYVHSCLGAVTRGQKERIKINILMCSRRYRSKEAVKKQKVVVKNPLVYHVLRIETSSKNVIDKIEKAGFATSKAKKGKRLLIINSDIRELVKIAKRLQEITGGFIESKFYVGVGLDAKTKIRHNDPAIIIPAKNLVLGHYLPIRRGNTIVYDEIIEIKKELKEDFVYDLEIDKTHNFLAQGIVVHNSIFHFQGASFNNVLMFKTDYPKSKEIVLVENYRSPQNILDLAYGFIQFNNPNRLEYQLNTVKDLQEKAKEKGLNLEAFQKITKKLKSNQDKKGAIELLAFETGDDEIRGVINKIWELKEIDGKASFSDFAILTRTNESANSFSRALDRANIPYQFISSKGLYTNPLILDVISYFKTVINFYDSASFYRVLRMLPLEITPEEVARITQYGDKKGIPAFEAIQDSYLLNKLTGQTLKKLEILVRSLKKHFNLAKEKNASEIFVEMINDLGYDKKLADTTEENLRNWELLYQFYQKIKDFEDSQIDGKLMAFVENLQMELDAGEEGELKVSINEDYDAVKIMTVHSAKGLEFKYVFIVNLVTRKFPSDERSDPIEIPEALIQEILPSGDFHLEEERRLFYVALTRAKRGLFLTWAADYGGKQLKKPSRFLQEAKLISEEALAKQKFVRGANFCFGKSINNGFKMESNETDRINGNVKQFLPDHFSFSQLASFTNCPLQYKFAQILRIPVRGRANFSFGKTIHNTLHKFVGMASRNLAIEQKSLFPSTEKDGKVNLGLNDLLQIYEKEWIDDWHDAHGKKEYFEKGKEVLKRFFEDFTGNGFKVLLIANEPALEKTFSLKINGDKFIGAIDRIDDIGDEMVEIIDYKTGVPKKSLGTDEKLQLSIYHVAAETIFGLKTKRLTYYYVEDGTTCSFEPKPGDAEKTLDKIKDITERIKRSNFKPSPGWHCQYCDFKDICSHRKT